jgi:hypothetical protein
MQWKSFGYVVPSLRSLSHIGATSAFAAAVLTAGLATGACSASGDAADASGSNSGGNGSGSGASGGVGGELFGGAATGGGGSGIGGGCADSTVTADLLPLDMYIMLDQSGSMGDSVSNGSKWSAVTSALDSFLTSAPDGMGVGIQYFPYESGASCPLFCSSNADCGAGCGTCVGFGMGVCSGEEACDIAEYETPDVPIGLLPGDGPTGNTPTSAALQGAVNYAATTAAANPNRVVVVVLATDGDPTECDTSLSAINGIAATAAAGSPAILTFVIGVGSQLSALNGIAAAGGTGQAFLVDANQDLNQQFQDALNQIQGSALGCTYAIPQPEEGTPDFDSLNVAYSPGDGSGMQTFPRVSGPGECTGDGWYYDNNAAPTKIILCDASCDKVSADDMGQVDVVIGCETVVK